MRVLENIYKARKLSDDVKNVLIDSDSFDDKEEQEDYIRKEFIRILTSEHGADIKKFKIQCKVNVDKEKEVVTIGLNKYSIEFLKKIQKESFPWQE